MAADGKIDRRYGMRGPREGRAPVDGGHPARPAHVGDVEDHRAAMPVADIEPAAAPDRVMAAMRPALPGRGLAAGGPLPRHPPASDLLRPRRIEEVENHHDVADITLDLRRDV